MMFRICVRICVSTGIRSGYLGVSGDPETPLYQPVPILDGDVGGSSGLGSGQRQGPPELIQSRRAFWCSSGWTLVETRNPCKWASVSLARRDYIAELRPV